MIVRCIVLACTLWLAAPPGTLRAQDAEAIAGMLVRDLSPTGSMEAGQWFTDQAGQTGLGIIYAHIPGSAGSVSIHAGLYRRADTGWTMERGVEGLFGMSPADAVFLGDRVEVTTTMLGPDDPRCCPSLFVRWSIDLASGMATRLN